jgi:hypothetical protein
MLRKFSWGPQSQILTALYARASTELAIRSADARRNRALGEMVQNRFSPQMGNPVAVETAVSSDDV